MAVLNRRSIFKIKKPEAVPIQAKINPFHQEKNLRILCDCPSKSNQLPGKIKNISVRDLESKSQ
jgi:hypothetical protein